MAAGVGNRFNYFGNRTSSLGWGEVGKLVGAAEVAVGKNSDRQQAAGNKKWWREKNRDGVFAVLEH